MFWITTLRRPCSPRQLAHLGFDHRSAARHCQSDGARDAASRPDAGIVRRTQEGLFSFGRLTWPVSLATESQRPRMLGILAVIGQEGTRLPILVWVLSPSLSLG